jgi:hypothetical protein
MAHIPKRVVILQRENDSVAHINESGNGAHMNDSGNTAEERV